METPQAPNKKRKTESPESGDALDEDAAVDIADLKDEDRQAIYEDRIECSDDLRSKVQGPSFYNAALLPFLSQACRYWF